ncbi:hypothetical protein, partial [Pseudophaeobacter arcticus]|uniref:hypothetical protein n=1 Tax=Pseudophaeobacter arcticus TaxID=385492 RepID=UPI0039E6FEBA
PSQHRPGLAVTLRKAWDKARHSRIAKPQKVRHVSRSFSSREARGAAQFNESSAWINGFCHEQLFTGSQIRRGQLNQTSPCAC